MSRMLMLEMVEPSRLWCSLLWPGCCGTLLGHLPKFIAGLVAFHKSWGGILRVKCLGLEFQRFSTAARGRARARARSEPVIRYPSRFGRGYRCACLRLPAGVCPRGRREAPNPPLDTWVVGLYCVGQHQIHHAAGGSASVSEPLNITTTEIQAQADQGNDVALALASGMLVASVRSLISGQHITLKFKAAAKVDGKWSTVPLGQATHVFIEVPGSGGRDSYNDKAGTYYPPGTEQKWAGHFFADRQADPARVWTARMLLNHAAGRPTAAGGEIILGSACLRCGRELEHPESVLRNMGPDCAQLALVGSHERKGQAEDLDFGQTAEDDMPVQTTDLDEPPAEGEAPVWAERAHDVEPDLFAFDPAMSAVDQLRRATS